MTEQRKPSLEDIGRTFLRSRLPLVPYDEVGQMTDPQAPSLFTGHMESKSLTRMYAGRLATKKITTSNSEQIEFALVSKAHPYLQDAHSEAMVQYFGTLPLNRFVDFEGEHRNLGEEYLGLVEKTTRIMLDIDKDEKKRYVISVNVAPYSRFTDHRNNVQSLAAPHTHIVGFSENEAQQMEFMNNFSDEEEKRVFNGQYDIMNATYRDLVNQLLEPYALRYLGYSFRDLSNSIVNNFGLVQNSPPYDLARSATPLSPGFNFSINSLADISKPEFLEKIIAFEKCLGFIYTDLANIFVENSEDINSTTKNPKPLELSSEKTQLEKLHKFVATNNENLKPDTLPMLQKAVSLSPLFLDKDTNTIDEKILLRGYAYSLIAHPSEWGNPNGNWDISLPLWLYGGGGIEAMGINKIRSKQVESEENRELLVRYIERKEKRIEFNKTLVSKLHEMDPQIIIL